MLAETIRIFVATEMFGREHYPTTLFAAGDAQSGRCTARSPLPDLRRAKRGLAEVGERPLEEREVHAGTVRGVTLT